MQLQRMPSRPFSSAMARVRLMTPPFAVQYAARAGSTQKPFTEAMFTIEPPPALRMRGMAARAHR